jgi:hypothetical protein
MGRSLPEAIRISIRKNATWMLEAEGGEIPLSICGLAGMRQLASDLPEWKALPDWSWAARFGYQIIVKRGAGGLFFRSIYRDFLAEAASLIPGLRGEGLVEKIELIGREWGDAAAVLKEQSEREVCAPGLFREAGKMISQLARREEELFLQLARIAEDAEIWESASVRGGPGERS